MDVEVLKKQIGDNILNSLDDFRAEENKSMGKKVAILRNGSRKAKITLNAMDLYNITLIDGNSNFDIKRDVYNNQLRKILNDFFNFSLKQALDNEDEQREQEIREKVENGETVRII